jgi:CTP:molybdopterin cytidylyltransferase MocA
MTTGSIGALVLAAGKGTRIGTAKLRLSTGGESFLHRCVRTLHAAGVDVVAGVVSPEERAWAIAEVPGTPLMSNPSDSGDMLSSVRLGLELVTSCKSVVILPVDHPCVQAETVKKLVAAGRSEGDAVIKPSYQGRAGHPVLIPRTLFARVLSSGDRDTLHTIIAASGVPVTRVVVDDPGVLRNINTPEDLSAVP